MVSYLYIFLTILFTVYGQIVLKWQIAKAGTLPPGIIEKVWFLLQQFSNPWILSGFFAAVIAALSWMAALTRFELSFAYPFMSISFFLVVFLSIIFFQETFNYFRLGGLTFIVIGIILLSQG